MRINSLIGVLVIIVQATSVWAVNKIPFEPLDSEEGLSLVKDIYRDDNDFLWIATGGFGLIRYDSYEMKFYTHASESPDQALSDNITKLYEDSQGHFWVATFSGLDKFDRKEGHFTNYLRVPFDSSDYTSNQINDMVEDRNGLLWVATGNGLYVSDPMRDTFQLVTDATLPNEKNSFKALAIDHEDNIWVTTYNEAIYCYYPATNYFEAHPLTGLNTQQQARSMRLFIDSENLIWVGFENHGAAVYDRVSKQIRHFTVTGNRRGLSSNILMDINEYNGLIYLATDQGGINIYDKKTELFTYISTKYQNAGSLSSDGIYSLYQDKENILWVGTSRGGVNYYNPKKHRFSNLFEANNVRIYHSLYKPIAHGVVGTFFEDSKGLIWIGTNGGGINTFNRNTGEIQELSSKNSNLYNDIVGSISEDSEGNIWVACWPHFINKYIRKEKRFIRVIPPIHPQVYNLHHTVWATRVDQKDRVWLNYTEGHVVVLDKNGQELARHKAIPDPPHYYGHSGYFAELDKYYIINTDGVYWLNEQVMQFEQFIEKSRATCFRHDKRGNYWLGTNKDGIYGYNEKGQQIAHYTTHNGLSNNTVYSMECSPTGSIWVATNNGLNEINPITSQIFQYFDSDGLQGNQYFYQSSLKTRDGQLFFGGIEGVDFFYPQKIVRNRFLPKSHLIKVEVKDKQGVARDITHLNSNASPDDVLHLTWKENMLVFNFFAVNYTYQEKTQYKYCLLGSEPDEWIETSNRQATYTNLKPGTYTFKVLACNNDAVWNSQGDEFHFIIDSPFWQKGWFYALCIVFLGICFLLAIRLRSHALLRDKETLQKKVAERTQLIEEQKSKLLKNQTELELHRDKLEDLVKERTFELEIAKEKAENSDRLKSAFLANMSHEIRTPMNAIVGFSALLGDRNFNEEEHKNFVKTIVANSNALLVLIEDILDFSLIEANQLTIELHTFNLQELIKDVYDSQSIALQDKPITMRLEHDATTADLTINSDPGRVRQILTNLTSNAIKFTNQGYIILGSRMARGQLEIYVKDTGVGIKESELQHIFGRFVKLDQVKTTIRGLGLGLSISKRIAKLLGGDIYVWSIPGEGSTFTLELPASLILGEVPAREIEVKKEDENYEWKDKHILIVEDEQANYDYLVQVLKKTHVHIQIAEDGWEAVELFKKGQSYDMVLMDIKMPRLNGYEAMKKIRDIKPDQLIIAQTAYAQPQDQTQIMEKGFNDYLSKPITPGYLFEVLGKYLH